MFYHPASQAVVLTPVLSCVRGRKTHAGRYDPKQAGFTTHRNEPLALTYVPSCA
jgi:hypothetical protein